MIRVGLVDFDTSHVVVFTQRMNGIDAPPEDCVQGACVVAGYPGESVIMPERIGDYTEQLRGWGVEIVDRPGDLIGRIDAVMIESQQGSRHLAPALPFLEAGIPTFVDKPFAPNVAEADAMLAAARKSGAPLMSCSALRYDPSVQSALAARDELGSLLSAEVYTPAALHDGNPGLLHYGIHGVEMLFTLMGAGCVSVRCDQTEQGDITVGRWDTGELGVVRGLRTGDYGFGFAAHYERGHRHGVVEGAGFYTAMLQQIVRMFETRVEPIPLAETRAIVAFCEAAETSARANGATVPLP